MTAETVMYSIVVLGAGSTLATMVVAIRGGKRAPVRRGPWIAALVLAAIPAAFIFMISTKAASMDSEAGWLVVGDLGLWALFVTSLIRPRWGGVCFIASGLALPILLWIGGLLVPSDAEGPLEIANAIVIYSIRALVTGAFLLWSAAPRGPAAPPTTA